MVVVYQPAKYWRHVEHDVQNQLWGEDKHKYKCARATVRLARPMYICGERKGLYRDVARSLGAMGKELRRLLFLLVSVECKV